MAVTSAHYGRDMDFASKEEAKRYCQEHGVPLGRLSDDELALLSADQLEARSEATRAWSRDELTLAQDSWVRQAIDREERVRRAMGSS